MDLADDLFSVLHGFQQRRLDLNNVFQLSVGARLPAVVHPQYSHCHHYGESVHGALH
jgi:hypothetical protein